MGKWKLLLLPNKTRPGEGLLEGPLHGAGLSDAPAGAIRFIICFGDGSLSHNKRDLGHHGHVARKA